MQNGVKKITSAFYDVSCRLKIRASIIESILKAETEYVKTLKYIVEVSCFFRTLIRLCIVPFFLAPLAYR